MTRRNLRGRLELTWMGKDQALIPTEENTYDYTWVDKDDPRACQTHYLIDGGHVGDTSDGGIHDNLLISGESGDVLEALTRVPELADKYVGRVKCVYIDPPFNTEKAFDHYEDNLEHSVWLTMMRDRLMLIKRLLNDDGSIWVHLDMSENHRMRLLLDEVFGPGNFIAEVSWEKKDSPKMDDQGVSITHDTILVYRKSAAWRPNKFETKVKESDFPKVDEDGRPYSSRELRKWGRNSLRTERPTMWYPIKSPSGQDVYPIRPDGQEGCWRWEPKTVQENYDRLEWLDMPQPVGLTPYVKSYMDAGKQPLPPRSLWGRHEVGGNPAGKAEIKALFPGIKPFDTPKPERLLERILHIATNPGDLVLDCFGGSGTTAAVAHKMGRRWITCELLPENVETFILPRLSGVVAGNDLGGITMKTEYVPLGTLPGNTKVEEARLFNTVLTRTLKYLNQDEWDDPESEMEADAPDLDGDTIAALEVAAKVLKKATSVKKAKTQLWHGGGGFNVAKVSPIWVDVEIDEATAQRYLYISADATGEVLERSLAAHLGFYFTPENPRFAGVKGRQRLAIVEGLLTEAKLDEILEALPESESVMVVCDGAPEGMSSKLQNRVRGSRLRVMPDDLFTLNTGRGI